MKVDVHLVRRDAGEFQRVPESSFPVGARQCVAAPGPLVEQLLEPVRPGTAGAAPRQHVSDLGDPDEFALEGVVEHLLELIEADERRHVEERAGGARDRKAGVDPDVLAVEVLGAVRADPGVADRRVAVDENVDRSVCSAVRRAQSPDDGRRDVAETGRQRGTEQRLGLAGELRGGGVPDRVHAWQARDQVSAAQHAVDHVACEPGLQKLPAGDPSALTVTDLRGLLIRASPSPARVPTRRARGRSCGDFEPLRAARSPARLRRTRLRGNSCRSA